MNVLDKFLQKLDAIGVVLVAASGNAPPSQYSISIGAAITQRPQLWSLTPGLSNMIVVGASDQLSCATEFSIEMVGMLWAPGENIWVAKYGAGMEKQEGTSLAAPLVAGLVAYMRGTSTTRYARPADVKVELRALSRRVQVGSIPTEQLDRRGYEDLSTGNRYGRIVSPVWNGQRSDSVSCIMTPADPLCPQFQRGQFLDGICRNEPVTKKRGLFNRLSRRQEVQVCPYRPGEGNGSSGGGGSGSGSGSDNGGNVNGQDQLGPSKTVTYSSGTPSPTCTSGYGKLYTDD